MAYRFQGGHVEAYEPAGADASEEVVRLGRSWVTRTAGASWRDFAPAQALEACWKLIREANRYIDAKKPWELGKDPQRLATGPGSLNAVLAVCCEALRTTGRLIAPAMPGTARRILHQLGRPESEADAWPTDGEFGWPGGQMGAPEPLFPRLDAERKAALIAKWLPLDPTGAAGTEAPRTEIDVTPGAPAGPTTSPSADGGGTTPQTGSGTPPTPATVEKADFDRVELRAAKIVACERVPKTDKLLKLTVDIGTEKRTVISGIAGAYAPEALLGRTVVYLANLRPAKIRGVVSQGMILTAGEADVLALSALDREVPPGTRIK
jgi:methionyl-tRNA synthetase